MCARALTQTFFTRNRQAAVWSIQERHPVLHGAHGFGDIVATALALAHAPATQQKRVQVLTWWRQNNGTGYGTGDGTGDTFETP